MWRYMESKRPSVFVPSIEEGVRRVRDNLTPRGPAGGAQVVDFCPGLCRAQADHIHFVYVNKLFLYNKVHFLFSN